MYTNKKYIIRTLEPLWTWQTSIIIKYGPSVYNIIDGSRERSLFCAKSDGRRSRARHKDRARLLLYSDFGVFFSVTLIMLFLWASVEFHSFVKKSLCRQFFYNTNVPTYATAVTGWCGRCGRRGRPPSSIAVQIVYLPPSW